MLWALLALSSLSLHLLYNSVIFQSIGTNDYISNLGSSTIESDPAWNASWQDAIAANIGMSSERSAFNSDLQENLCTDSQYCSPQLASNVSVILGQLHVSLIRGNSTRLEATECLEVFDTSSSGSHQGCSAVVLVSNLTDWD